jgi:hypothetical protein
MGDAVRRAAGRVFVGRDREMAELVSGLEDAAGGRGRLFLIAGEPGIGKTWLAERVAEYASSRGIRVVWGRCWEGGGAPPFWPWTQAIGALAEDHDEDTVAGWMGVGAAHVAQIVPVLAERLGIDGEPVGAAESEASRFYQFEATTRFLRHAAAAQPLLVVLEDLHAADEASLLLLQFLARQLRGSRLLVMGTYRDVDADRQLAVLDAVGQLLREGQLVTLWRLPLLTSPPSTTRRTVIPCSCARLCASWPARLPASGRPGVASPSRAACGWRSSGGWRRCLPTPSGCCRRRR